MDSAAAEADFRFTWLDETSKEHSQFVTWPTDQREDDDFHEAPPSTNMLIGENDPMWCAAIVRSRPPTFEGCATFSVPTKEDIASHTIMDFGKPSAGMEIDWFADSVVKDLFEDLTWTNYAWEDAEKKPHLPLKTDLDLRMYPESAYKSKEETDFENSFKMRDAQPDRDSSKTNVVFPKRKPLMERSNLMETQSTNTGKHEYPHFLSHTLGTVQVLSHQVSPVLTARFYLFIQGQNTSALKRQSENLPPMKLHRSSRKNAGASTSASTSASKINLLGGILTRDLKAKSTEAMNQEEKKQMLESVKQARALLLTLMYQDGTTQLQSEQVSRVHFGLSGPSDAMLSRAGVTVCYRAKDLLSVTLQLCRQHFSWKQVSGCRIQDPHVSGWLLDPEDPCSCYRELHWKHTHKNLPPATPATVSFFQCILSLWTPLNNSFRVKPLWHVVVTHLVVFVLYCSLCQTKMNQLEQDAHRAAGEYFLITSTIQIRQVLFEKLRLHERLNKKMLPQYMATREDTASSQTDVHPLPKIILEYREVCHSLHSPFISMCNVTLIHDCFSLQMGSRNEFSWRLEAQLYCGVNDHVPFSGFCQLELRLLAHFSNDDKLINLFTNTDSDVYAVLASEWWVPHIFQGFVLALFAKLTYSSSFMCSSAGRDCLANTMGVTLLEARRFQDNFFLKFPKVKDFILMTMQQCRKHGFVCSLVGRQRPLRHILSKDTALRSQSEKKALAFVLQGRSNSRLMAHFSDELLFEVEEAQVEEFAGDHFGIWKDCVDFLEDLNLKNVSVRSPGEAQHGVLEPHPPSGSPS
uniref:DNA-directed DNA polymerase family A palm domain-containing protein n=1 Tax=Hippocampus comes TaxID=109280 RepID=A0A3Q2Z9T2_HIPCM